MRKKRILIVDDDDNMRSAIKRLLSVGQNYEIDEASDGFAAEKKVKELSPDLIVLDIRMPGMYGYEVCLNIRKNVETRHIKIVSISGISGGIGNAIISALGADSYFEKPFDNDKFKNGIAALLAEV